MSVVDILMQRDQYDRQEAEALFANTRNKIREAMSNDADYEDVEEILMTDLGLEMDYIFEFLL